jgi:transposase
MLASTISRRNFSTSNISGRFAWHTDTKSGSIADRPAIHTTFEVRLVFRLHDCRISTNQVIAFLEQMLKHHCRRHLVVVMDHARPHTSKQTQAYLESRPRLHVFYLPPYSPDWNPNEKIWNRLKHEELKSHTATSKPELIKISKRNLQRCRVIRSYFAEITSVVVVQIYSDEPSFE